jgi:hypothetical protein
MPGVIIYKNSEKYHIYNFPDRTTYRTAKEDIRKNKDKIVWKKGNVSFEQIQNARETMNSLVRKLNENEELNLEAELAKVADFFPCGESH